MTKRTVFQSLFVLLLLAGQQIALVHSVWHLGNHAPAQKRYDSARAAQGQQNDGQSQQSRLCDLHSALGNLLAGDCGSLPAIAADTASHSLASHAAVWRVAQPAATPPSRAPPVLL
jgi:hypothetical protein